MASIPRRPTTLRAGLILTACIAGAASPASAAILELSPIGLPLHHPVQDLPAETRDAARSAMYERADRSDHGVQDALDLAILLTTDGSVEGRVDARAYFEEARAAAPERLDIILWESQARAWGRDYAGAIEVLEEGRDRFGSMAEWHYARGVYQWLRGVRTLKDSALDAAHGDFSAALASRPESRPYRLGLAATCLARMRWQELLEVTDVADDHPAMGPRLVLYRGCALAALGRDEEAHPLMSAVVRTLAPSVRAVFEDGEGFLAPADGDTTRWVRGYWRALDPHPARVSNARQLEYWRRLVEADVLFGGEGEPGWTTPPGETWVRFGRPVGMFFQSADIVPFGSLADPKAQLEAKLAGGETPDAFAQFMPAMSDHSTEFDPRVHRWHWSYAYGDQSFMVTFLDTTFDFGWMTSGTSNRTVEAKVRETPLFFPEAVPRVSIGLDVALAGFLDEAAESSLETTIGVRVPFGQPVEVDVEWAVYDEKGRRIDRVTRRLDADRRLSALVAQVHPEARGRAVDALVTQVGARLAPGRFRVAVEATHPASGAHESREFLVDLIGMPDAGLASSDLLLSASFDPIEAGTSLPSEFVRHARAVIGVPSRTFAVEDPHAYVYYEVYGLERDDAGRGDVEISYQIHPVADGRRLGTKPAREVSFLEEDIEMGVRGNLVKGTRLDLSGLGPGDYALTVVVKDLFAQRETRRESRFRLASPAGR